MTETLYKKDNLGNIRIWKIHAIPIQGSIWGWIIVEHGIVYSLNIQTDKRYVKEGKNIGKANETTPYTQALLEAEAEVIQKKKEGYYSLKDLQLEPAKDELGELTEKWARTSQGKQCLPDYKTLKEALDVFLPNEKEVGKNIKIPQPMLAHKYCSEKGKQSGAKTWEQLKITGEFYIQPKIDGLRCLANIRDGSVCLYSRTGEIYKGLEHIKKDILTTYTSHEEIWLDGELYTDTISFNKLNGYLRRTKGDQDKELEESIVYNIFDIMDDKVFSERDLGLSYWDVVNEEQNIKSIKIVETVCLNMPDTETTINILKQFHDDFIKQGHEGLMIRKADSKYEHKRSWNLIKMKEFEDDEFIIIGGEEAKRNGELGAFIVISKNQYESVNMLVNKKFEDPDNLLAWKAIIKDNDNNLVIHFKATPKFSLQERREMWTNLKDYIGREVTVEYFGKSIEFGIPRFPRAIKIH